MIIPGFIDSSLLYHPTCAVLQATETSSVPTDLDISPSLVAYEYGSKQIIDVPISNITTRTVVIQPRAILCEIQPVTIEERHPEEENRADFANILGAMEIDKKGLSERQIEEGIQVISSFAADIISTGDHDLVIKCCPRTKERWSTANVHRLSTAKSAYNKGLIFSTKDR